MEEQEQGQSAKEVRAVSCQLFHGQATSCMLAEATSNAYISSLLSQPQPQFRMGRTSGLSIVCAAL
jgi:hypothetical protein